MHNKVDTIKGKLRTVELMLGDLAADLAADATLVPTGELALQKDEHEKKYLLMRVDFLTMGKKFIEDFRERL